MSDNVRTLDFGREDEPAQLMPEDVFESGVNPFADEGEAVPQFTEESLGTVVTGDFGPEEEPDPLAIVSLHHSAPFVYLQVPEIGLEAPISVGAALALFDALGDVVNAL